MPSGVTGGYELPYRLLTAMLLCRLHVTGAHPATDYANEKCFFECFCDDS